MKITGRLWKFIRVPRSLRLVQFRTGCSVWCREENDGTWKRWRSEEIIDYDSEISQHI